MKDIVIYFLIMGFIEILILVFFYEHIEALMLVAAMILSSIMAIIMPPIPPS